jgi:hypothetical protein
MNRAAARFRNSNAKPEPRAHAPFRIAGFCFLCAWRIKSGHRGGLMIIEMRTYQIKAGMRAQFLEIFRAKSVPAHAQVGMKILGPFLSVEDPDTFFFMRGFPDLASREPMKAKFYEGELWKRELESVLMPMLEKYEVVVVEDPENLIRWSTYG